MQGTLFLTSLLQDLDMKSDLGLTGSSTPAGIQRAAG